MGFWGYPWMFNDVQPNLPDGPTLCWAEVEIRAVGVGFCMSVGRCGSVAAAWLTADGSPLLSLLSLLVVDLAVPAEAPAVFSVGQHVMGASPFITRSLALP